MFECSTDLSKAVRILIVFFVCVLVVPFVAFSVIVCSSSHFVFLSCLEKNALHGCSITKTCLLKYILKILSPKNENFQIKIRIFFHISAQNIDCGYSLEPPHRGGSNEYPQPLFFEQK